MRFKPITPLTGISIHALREEGDPGHGNKSGAVRNFYPRPPRGGRPNYPVFPLRCCDFYPRPPRGGRPTSVGCVTFWFLFLSTPSARRATWHAACRLVHEIISIHALREEGDGVAAENYLFSNDFYPRPPRGGRRMDVWTECYRRDISIHALREEGDTSPLHLHFIFLLFLSTPSARRATPPSGGSSPVSKDFYPRPPRGGRPCGAGATLLAFLFLSTPSARRATSRFCATVPVNIISIHALREEGDFFASTLFPEGVVFLSTPSARRATGRRCLVNDTNGISIHALREEGDHRSWHR